MSVEKRKSLLKIIGAGWGRTGTSSFKKAMDILGQGPCYHMFEVFANADAKFWVRVVDGKPYDFDEVFGGKFQSSCDLPACVYWKEMLAKYPDAKVILTTRSPESWYTSVMDTIYHFQPASPKHTLGIRIAQMIGLPTPGFKEMMEKIVDRDAHHYDYSKEGLVRWFMERNQRIIEECPKEKLLVFEAKDGWAPLCKFLDLPIPDVPYPHENDTPAFKKIILLVNIVGYVVLMLGITAIVGLLYIMKAKTRFGKDL